jgi:hypothetical protein
LTPIERVGSDQISVNPPDPRHPRAIYGTETRADTL